MDINVTLMISTFSAIIANLGTVIILHIHLDKKIEAGRKETNGIIMSIQQEMKDFHGRLCAIEERNRK